MQVMSSQKIRVLRIANRLNIGGPTYNVCYLTKHLGDSYETLLLAGQEDTSEGSFLVAKSMGFLKANSIIRGLTCLEIEKLI